MNKYTVLVFLGLIIWIVETAYFGWNKTPQSPLETMLDALAWIFIFWGIIGDILNGLVIHKDTNISTKNVVMPNVKNAELDEETTMRLVMPLITHLDAAAEKAEKTMDEIVKGIKKEKRKVAPRKVAKNGKKQNK